MTKHPHGEQLSAYLDGMLDVRHMHQIAQHVSVCDQCLFLQKSLGQTRQTLRQIPSPPMPGPDFWADTYRRLRTEGAARPSWGVSLRETLATGFRSPSRRWAAGVAAAAVIGAAVTGPLMSHGPQAAVPTGSADSVDISSLVRAHAASAAQQPLADPDRQAMLSADTDDSQGLSDGTLEAAGDGGSFAADAAH
jgi:hypothetical protein